LFFSSSDDDDDDDDDDDVAVIKTMQQCAFWRVLRTLDGHSGNFPSPRLNIRVCYTY